MANDTWVLRWHHWSVAMLIHCYDDMLPLPFFFQRKNSVTKMRNNSVTLLTAESLRTSATDCIPVWRKPPLKARTRQLSHFVSITAWKQSCGRGSWATVCQCDFNFSPDFRVCFSFRSSALLSKGVCFPPMSLFLNKLCSRSLMHHLVELLIPNITHCASYWTNMLQIHAHKYTLALSPVSVS